MTLALKFSFFKTSYSTFIHINVISQSFKCHSSHRSPKVSTFLYITRNFLRVHRWGCRQFTQRHPKNIKILVDHNIRVTQLNVCDSMWLRVQNVQIAGDFWGQGDIINLASWDPCTITINPNRRQKAKAIYSPFLFMFEASAFSFA